jgi:hypothetical protein
MPIGRPSKEMSNDVNRKRLDIAIKISGIQTRND